MSIRCERIEKTYTPTAKSPVQALKGISLDIKAGEVYGVLGQNGAGKTTLVQILSTQLNPSAGQATVLGLDIRKHKRDIRRRINVITGGEAGLYPWLSARQMLEYFAYLYKLPRKVIKPRVVELLTLVGLDDATWDRPSMTLSKGQKQRIMIAKGLINDPDLIFLDEPTIGLDVKAVRETRELISGWAAQGKTVILTSHNMGDIESTCDRLCIIQNGVIHVEKTLSSLQGDYKNIVSLTLQGQWTAFQQEFEALGRCHQVHQKENQVEFKIALPVQNMGALYQSFSQHPDRLLHVDVKQQSLEDIYLDLIESEGSV